MADNVILDNGDLTDFTSRSSETASGQQIQHVRIDFGTGTAEDVVASGNGLPVTGSFSSSTVTFSNLLATTATATSTSGVILAANASRESARITNIDTSGITAFINGGTATTSHFPIRPGESFEVPKGYTGAIEAITASSTAVLRCIEGD